MPHPLEHIFPFPPGLTDEEKVELYEFSSGYALASLGAPEDAEMNMFRGIALARRQVKNSEAPAAAAAAAASSASDFQNDDQKVKVETKAATDARSKYREGNKETPAAAAAAAASEFQHGDQKVKVETKAATEAKSKYRKAKKKAASAVSPKKANICGYCNKEGTATGNNNNNNNNDNDDRGSGNKQYKMCSQCLSVAYCSKECQKADWKKGHKEVCKFLALLRVQGTQPPDAHPPSALEDIPVCGIVLPTSLTGYPKGVLVNIPAWDFHDDKAHREFIDEHNQKEKEERLAYGASVVQSIQYFFKRERLGLSQDLSGSDVCKLSYDTMMLFLLRYPGIREITHEERGKNALLTFSLCFQHYTPVPKDWKMDPVKMMDASPEQIAKWEKAIEATRKELGEF